MQAKPGGADFHSRGRCLVIDVLWRWRSMGTTSLFSRVLEIRKRDMTLEEVLVQDGFFADVVSCGGRYKVHHS
jgi:hypothetical protein